MLSFLHTFHPYPIIATIGPITLYWYGFFYLVGIILTIFILQKTLKKLEPNNETTKKLNDQLPNVIFWTVVFGLIGARVYYVFLELPYYLLNPIKILNLNEGGLAIHGGLIGGGLFLWQYAKKNNYSLLWLFDLFAPVLLLAQAIGRWGNYFNQELFGRPTNLPWGIPISFEHRPELYLNYTYFHPTFLYESLWDIVGFVILFNWQNKNAKNKPSNNGLIFFTYLAYVATGRLFVEFFRVDPIPFSAGLRIHIIIAFLILMAGLAGLATLLYKRRV